MIVERDDFVAAGLRLPGERRAALAHAEKGAIGKPVDLFHIGFRFRLQTQRAIGPALFA